MVKIRNIEDQVPPMAGDNPAKHQGYMNAIAMCLLLILVVVVGVWSMWIVPTVEPEVDSQKAAIEKLKNLSGKQKDSGKGSKVPRAKDKKQQQLPKGEIDKDEKSLIVPDISGAAESSQRDDSKAEKSDTEDEEWVDVPLNTSKKPSVTFDDNIELQDEDYEPPSDNSPSSIAQKDSRDKNKKKDKETPEQRQARLERKAQAKKQKEQQEVEEKKAFEDKLKASETAARLQAEEDEKARRAREENSAKARADEADWVVHTKKADRRVKTFEELLEERIAKATVLADVKKNAEAAIPSAGMKEQPNGEKSNSNSSKSNNSNSSNSGKSKKGNKGSNNNKKDVHQEVDGEPKERAGEKKEKRPRNDKKNKEKQEGSNSGNSKGKQPQAEGNTKSSFKKLGTVEGGSDISKGGLGAPPGLSQLGADRPRFETMGGRGGGQIYIPPMVHKPSNPSPDRTKTSPTAAAASMGVPGGDDLWPGPMDPLSSLPQPLPRMSGAESTYGSSRGGGVSTIRRPDSDPSSRENTPRDAFDTASIITLSDLEKSLMSITK